MLKLILGEKQSKIRGFLAYLFTYSMEQCLSWEANWFSTSQEVPRILWKLEVYYLIHKCQPPVPILNQIDPVHVPTSHFLKSKGLGKFFIVWSQCQKVVGQVMGYANLLRLLSLE